ncbi:MAG: SHD1 domain-containing protein [Pirellulales bacterium]
MRIGKMMMAWTVALLMAVDSASACRWGGWSYCSPRPCYYPAYTSCGPVVSYSAANCPICAAAGRAPVTTHRAPTTATPQPRLEPIPVPAQPPAARELAPTEPMPSEPAAPGEAPPAPQPFEPSTEPLTPPTTEPPPEEPAAAPKPSQDVEDLFKEPAPAAAPPAAPETPAKPEPAKPADDVENLFKEPAAAPAEKPAMPAETPAKPADDVENLFKEDTKPAPAPAEEPAKPADDVENLFKDVDKKSAAAGQTPADPQFEDLLSAPTDQPGATATEAKALEDEVDKLFAGPAPKVEVAGAMRLWTDNTGKYHVRARLVVVEATHARLLKENGKYTTVPFERLSRDDLAFVRRHADQAIAASF